MLRIQKAQMIALSRVAIEDFVERKVHEVLKALGLAGDAGDGGPTATGDR